MCRPYFAARGTHHLHPPEYAQTTSSHVCNSISKSKKMDKIVTTPAGFEPALTNETDVGSDKDSSLSP